MKKLRKIMMISLLILVFLSMTLILTYTSLISSVSYNKSLKEIKIESGTTSIKIGDITVTPFSCDHAAYDSYMLLCESGGEAILYTGDFRSHGRVGIDALLAELPRNPDILICEGTELYRPEHIARTELELEKQAAKLFIETKGPVFALQMPLNIERTVSLYNAARQSSRVFIEDAYMAQIAKAAGEEIVSPDKQSDVYAFLPSILRFPWYKGIKNKATKELIVSTPFVMCVRPLMHGYIRRLSRKISFEGGILLYSCRKGLKKSKSMQKFIAECEKRGLETVYLHTGGHADAKTLKRFVETVSPKALMPIHTRNPKEFERLVPGVRICNTSVNDKQKGYSEKYEL